MTLLDRRESTTFERRIKYTTSSGVLRGWTVGIMFKEHQFTEMGIEKTMQPCLRR